MSEPAWVRERDGRLVPFEADRICRALFAAAAAVGRPDAFLARELTDSAVHFLADDGPTTTPMQIADVVAKVVRELGQPALARAYAERRGRTPAPVDADPADAARAALDRYSLEHVFAPDLASAHAEGLLTLGGLDAPAELAALIVEPPDGESSSYLERLLQAAPLAATLVMDGPEWALLRADAPATTLAETFARELSLVRAATGRRTVVHLNVPPPSWADDRPGGPLFAAETSASAPRRAAVADALLAALAPTADADARLCWHLGGRDFLPDNAERLRRVLALCRDEMLFVFDRPRQPTYLAAGLDRGGPATLLTVTLSRTQLAARVGPENVPGRLGSLARMAVSAAVQKRTFLRRRAAMGRGFLLERARLVVVAEGKGDERAMRDALRDAGRARAVDVHLDSAEEASVGQNDRTAAGLRALWSEGSCVCARFGSGL